MIRKEFKIILFIKYLSIILLFYPHVKLTASSFNANAVIDSIKNRFEQILDYQVDIKVCIDVDFINIPDKEATIYFKKPDKLKYKSDGFIMLPKKGLDFSIDNFLKYEYSAIYIGSEEIENKIASVIKIIPHVDNDEFILATLWVDTLSNQVIKIQANTKDKGSYTLLLTYTDSKDILPQKTVVLFELSQFHIPFEFIFDKNPDLFNRKEKEEITNGSVTIIYSNYKINQDLPNSFFKDKNQ